MPQNEELEIAKCRHCGSTDYEAQELYQRRQRLFVIYCRKCTAELIPCVVDYFDGKIYDTILKTWNAANSEAPKGWQPMETAPKDGTRFLACVPIKNHRLVIASYNDFGILLDEKAQPMYYAPSWWAPLPERPEFTTGEQHEPQS